MVNEYSHIRKEAEEIRINPPRGAWNRIESKLDSHVASRRLRFARLLSYAAAFALLCCMGFVAYYFASVQSYKGANLYSLSMEPLTSSPPIGSSIYDIEKVQELTEVGYASQ